MSIRNTQNLEEIDSAIRDFLTIEMVNENMDDVEYWLSDILEQFVDSGSISHYDFYITNEYGRDGSLVNVNLYKDEDSKEFEYFVESINN